MNTESFKASLLDYVISSHRTGSNYTCDPPVEDTDRDFILLVKDKKACIALCKSSSDIVTFDSKISENEDTEQATDPLEFKAAEPKGYDAFDFTSVRVGKDNLILTDNKKFYDKFVVATELAKRFNLLDKSDRIALFTGVIKGELPKEDDEQAALTTDS